MLSTPAHLRRIASTIAVASSLATVALARPSDGVDGPAPAATERAAFSETIPGTVVTFDMVPVAGGEVTIGDETVTVAPFWIGRTEVRWDAYDIYVFGLDAPGGTEGDADAVARPSKPYIAMDRGFGHAGYPAISMSYHGAQRYCAWLSQRTGRRYRLPTEAEWRLACGPTDGTAALDERAWLFENANYSTHPVASKAPNALGLHDMLGNAAEWCTGRDGRPVTMGGNYRTKASELESALRVPPTPAWNASDPQLPKSVWWLADAGFVGFRVVCEDGPSANGDDGGDGAAAGPSR